MSERGAQAGAPTESCVCVLLPTARTAETPKRKNAPGDLPDRGSTAPRVCARGLLVP
jgi:hypothetical protein